MPPFPPPTKIPAQPDVPEAPKADPAAAETAFRRGEAAFENGRYGEAIEAYGEAIRLNPKHAPAHTWRGRAYLLTAKYPEAIADYDQAIALDPKGQVFKYRNRAEAHWNSGSREAAAADFRKVLDLCEQECERDPKAAGPANRLAWTLATLPVAELRDGRRAVQLATAACQQTAFESYEYVGTLAAACAEAGDFPAAIKWSQQAIDRAPEARRPALTKELEAYRAGKPWRDPPQS